MGLLQPHASCGNARLDARPPRSLEGRGLGLVDVHNHKLESLEEVKAGLKRAMLQIPPEKIFPDPDCGLKTRSVAEAKAKLELVVRATREVKQEMGLD